MSGGERHGLSHHPAPRRGQARRRTLGFAVAGGPLAWFAQLCANYLVFTVPCYVGPDLHPERAAADTGAIWIAALLVYAVCLVVALAAGFVSLALFRRTRDETEGDLVESGHGRTRFVALWGLFLGFGFAAVILASAIVLIGVPLCAL